MEIQKQKDLYLAKLLEQEVIKQDEFEDLVFKAEINAFHSNYLSSRFMDNINFGWSAWQAAKAQAVPEGFVLVDKHQLAQLMANMDSFGKKALGDDYVSVSKGVNVFFGTTLEDSFMNRTGFVGDFFI